MNYHPKITVLATTVLVAAVLVPVSLASPGHERLPVLASDCAFEATTPNVPVLAPDCAVTLELPDVGVGPGDRKSTG